VFCACENIKLISVVFSIVGVEHIFDFGFVANETFNRCRLVFVTKQHAS
jgi:hypothetical protein